MPMTMQLIFMTTALNTTQTRCENNRQHYILHTSQGQYGLTLGSSSCIQTSLPSTIVASEGEGEDEDEGDEGESCSA